MSRAILCLTLGLTLITMTPSTLIAKPMQKTPLKVGVKKANLIVIAELSRHEYEDLKSGDSTELDTESLWRQYKVTKVLKNSTGRTIPLNTILQATSKSNSCIRFTTKVTRNKDLFRLLPKYKGAKVQLLSLKDLKAKHGQKLVLFLTVKKGIAIKPVLHTAHYGWFLSGSKWTGAYEKTVTAAIKKEKGA